MKAKIVALVLAAGLGVTGIAATAHAAAANENECSHADSEEVGSHKYGVYANPTHHLIINSVKYFCKDCGKYYTVDESEGYETHDYELHYCNDGTVRSYCTGCGDEW